MTKYGINRWRLWSSAVYIPNVVMISVDLKPACNKFFMLKSISHQPILWLFIYENIMYNNNKKKGGVQAIFHWTQFPHKWGLLFSIILDCDGACNFHSTFIKPTPLVTSIIHLGTGSLILQPIIGSLNDACCNLQLQATVADCILKKKVVSRGIQLPRHNI